MSPLYIFWFLHQTTTHRAQWFEISLLYIFWFLHQTTTTNAIYYVCHSCISFDSYIKPQLGDFAGYNPAGCISFDSYIKPQPRLKDALSDSGCISFDSYIKPQRWHGCSRPSAVVYLLIPTSNHNLYLFVNIPLQLYIFWFLHQTTTKCCIEIIKPRCISFDSYIKPQPAAALPVPALVVYLLIPTSNHN